MQPRTAKTTGWILVAVTAASGCLCIVTWTVRPGTIPWVLLVLIATIPSTFALVGALIISKRPENGLGWLFGVAGLVASISSLTQVTYDGLLPTHPDSSLGRWAAWITDVLNPVFVGLVTVFLFLLYPHGRLEDRASRRVGVATVVGIVLAVLAAAVEPHLQEFSGIPTPLRLETPASITWTVLGLGFALIGVGLIASIVLLVRKLRRSVGLEREQLRLLVWTSLVAAGCILLAVSTPPDAPDAVRNVTYLFGGLGLLLIPVSVGVAILRHRLLDIDLVLRRTLVIALLGGFITVVYIAIVVGVGTLVGSVGTPVLSAVAAAVVAIAFQPVRRRARRLADRFVYGERATPYEVLHLFSERVASSYGVEDVLPRMAAVLGEGTGASRAQVWLRVGEELQPTAVWPNGAPRSTAVPSSRDSLPPLPDVTYAVAVQDQGDLLGALSITKESSDPPSSLEEQRLVADLGMQASLVLRNARLLEELRASRQRLVSAQDEERRKIERNIHDGAQQQLVALAVKARLVDGMVDRDPEAAHRLAREMQADTNETLESLRELARGIYPSLLADRGLAAALEAQARRSPVDVRVHADGVGRIPREVEAAAYFCCLEAIQNVAKYAAATGVDVLLTVQGGELTFEVRDDGIGFDTAVAPGGSGLQNMADRVAALGGTLTVSSRRGVGTTISGRVPIG